MFNILRPKTGNDTIQSFHLRVLDRSRVMMTYGRRLYIWNYLTKNLEFEIEFPRYFYNNDPTILDENTILINGYVYNYKQDTIIHEFSNYSNITAGRKLIALESDGEITINRYIDEELLQIKVVRGDGKYMKFINEKTFAYSEGDVLYFLDLDSLEIRSVTIPDIDFQDMEILDDKIIINGDNFRIFDISGKEIFRNNDRVQKYALLSDNLIVIVSQNKYCAIVNFRDNKAIKVFKTEKQILDIKLLGNKLLINEYGELKLFDLDTYEIRKLDRNPHTYHIKEIYVLPNDKFITMSRQDDPKLWD